MKKIIIFLFAVAALLLLPISVDAQRRTKKTPQAKKKPAPVHQRKGNEGLGRKIVRKKQKPAAPKTIHVILKYWKLKDEIQIWIPSEEFVSTPDFTADLDSPPDRDKFQQSDKPRIFRELARLDDTFKTVRLTRGELFLKTSLKRDSLPAVQFESRLKALLLSGANRKAVIWSLDCRKDGDSFACNGGAR